MRTFLLLSLVVLCSKGFGQSQSGTVYYDESIQMEIHLPPGMQLPADFPKASAFKKVLTFTPEASVYQNAPQEEVTNEIQTEGMQVRFTRSIPDDIYYKDLNTGLKTEKRVFLEKVFIIEDSLPTYQWKITAEQKMVLNYVTQKATLMLDTVEVVAWFAPQIPAQNGPEGFGGLPGLILELTLDNGRRQLVATEIKLVAPDTPLEKPMKGKKISQVEFDKIREEKLAEMRAQYGGQGGVFIQTIKE